MAFTDKQFNSLKYIDDKLFAYGGAHYNGYVEIEPDIYASKYSFAILHKSLEGSWVDSGLQEIELYTNRTENDKYAYDIINFITKGEATDEYLAVGNYLSWADGGKNAIYGISIAGAGGAIVNASPIGFIPFEYGSGSIDYENYFDAVDSFNVARHSSVVAESATVDKTSIEQHARSHLNIGNSDNKIFFARNDSKIISLDVTAKGKSVIRNGNDIFQVEKSVTIAPEWNVALPNTYSSFYKYALLTDDRLLVVNGNSREYAVYDTDLVLVSPPEYVDSVADNSVGRCATLKNNSTGTISLLWYSIASGWAVYNFDQNTLSWSEQTQTSPIPNVGFSIQNSGFTGSHYYVIGNGTLYYSSDLSTWAVSSTGIYTIPFDGEGLHFFGGYYYLIGVQGTNYRLIRTADFSSWELASANDDYGLIAKCIVVANKLIIFAGSDSNSLGFYRYQSSLLTTPEQLCQPMFSTYSVGVKRGHNFLLANTPEQDLGETLYVNSAGTVTLEMPSFTGSHDNIDNKFEFVDFHNLQLEYFSVCDANATLTNRRTVPNPIVQYNIQNAEFARTKIIFDGVKYTCFIFYSTLSKYHIYAVEADILAPTIEWQFIGDCRIDEDEFDSSYDGLEKIVFNGKSYLLARQNLFFLSPNAKDWYIVDFYADDVENLQWKPRLLNEQFPGYAIDNRYEDIDDSPRMQFRPFNNSIYISPAVVIDDPKSFTVNQSLTEYGKFPDYRNYMNTKFSSLGVCDSYLIFVSSSTEQKTFTLYAYDGTVVTPIGSPDTPYPTGVDRMNWYIEKKSGNSVLLVRSDYTQNYSFMGKSIYYLEKVGDNLTVRWVINNDISWNDIYFTDNSLLADSYPTALLIDKATGTIDDSTITSQIVYSPALPENSWATTCATSEPSTTAISYPYSYAMNSSYEFIGTDIRAELPFIVGDEVVQGDYVDNYFYVPSIAAYVVVIYNGDADSYTAYKSTNLQTFERVTAIDNLFVIPETKLLYNYNECGKTDPITGECVIKIGEYEEGIGELQSRSNNISFYKMNGYTLVNVQVDATYVVSDTAFSSDVPFYQWYKTTDWITFTPLYFPKNYNPEHKLLQEYFVLGQDAPQPRRGVVDVSASVSNKRFAIGIAPIENAEGGM